MEEVPYSSRSPVAGGSNSFWLEKGETITVYIPTRPFSPSTRAAGSSMPLTASRALVFFALFLNGRYRARKASGSIQMIAVIRYSKASPRIALTRRPPT